MHGIILKGLKDFVVEQYDEETWRTLQSEAGVEGEIYVPVTEYPDEHVLSLVQAATEMTGIPTPDLLEAFGRFLVPPLVETYGVHVDVDWTGLELIANVESYIHTALRAKQLSTYTPPELSSRWIDENRVELVYTSERGLCHLARGLVAGVGEYYDEPFEITETACVHDGDDECVFSVESHGEVRAGSD